MTENTKTLLVHAIACPVLKDDIDTDALIPVSENTRMETTGFGDALFASWRYIDVAARTPDPEFILNIEPFRRAQILIAGSNFGCGSSRESAVWALRDYGIRAVLAVSFNETFQRNCVENGIIPLVLDAAAIASLGASVLANPTVPITIDLDGMAIVVKTSYPLKLDRFYRNLMVNGITESDLLRQFGPEIRAATERSNTRHPWRSAQRLPITAAMTGR